MQTLHLDSLASHIVAWHNRHPLARRIGIQHVQSMGYVVLPFEAAADTTVSATVSTVVRTVASAPAELDITVDLPIELAAEPQPEPADGGTLRERAMARAQQSASPATAPSPASSITPQAASQAVSHTATHSAPPAPKAARSAAPAGLLKPAFSEDFIQPLRPAAVAAFALQHGADEAMPGKDNPVRMVEPDSGLTLPLLQRRWLLTGQIEVDGRRSRLLAGAGRSPALLGRRLWSLPRVSLAVAGPLLMAAALVMGIRAMPPAVQPAVPERAAGAVVAASAASAAAASAAVAPSLTAAAPASAMPASATVPTAAPPGLPEAPASAPAAGPQTAQRPSDVDPTWGQVNLPSIGSVVDEKRRAALAARQAGSAPSLTPALAQTPAPAPASAPAPSSAAAPATAAPALTGTPPPRAGQPPAPAAAAGPVFALSTRLIRTKTESEQIADAVRGLLTTGGAPRLQVEAMRSGDDWRVVCWPFPTREQADKARALLASRGMKLQVVDF